MSTSFGFEYYLAFSGNMLSTGRFLYWNVQNARKYCPQTLRNRVRGPPKSSPEFSKTAFLKDIPFQTAEQGNRDKFLKLKEAIWLQLGGPRPYQMRPKTSKDGSRKAVDTQSLSLWEHICIVYWYIAICRVWKQTSFPEHASSQNLSRAHFQGRGFCSTDRSRQIAADPQHLSFWESIGVELLQCLCLKQKRI